MMTNLQHSLTATTPVGRTVSMHIDRQLTIFRRINDSSKRHDFKGTSPLKKATMLALPMFRSLMKVRMNGAWTCYLEEFLLSRCCRHSAACAVYATGCSFCIWPKTNLAWFGDRVPPPSRNTAQRDITLPPMRTPRLKMAVML